MMYTQSSVSYEVKVIGQAWGGFKASMEYSFSKEPTRSEIQNRADDFASLSKIVVTRVQRVICEDRTAVRVK